jgi:membrane associated rhomboid family serine protease
VILPISHERMSARRWPIVTTLLILACLAVQGVLTVAGTDGGAVYQRWGYVPASPSVLALVTSQFVHAGWIHLAGNMWFLFLCGVTLEDRWGRVVFPLFYLGSGVAAALAHGLFAPNDAAPLVGASGAIAGCMGAFAVAFARTPVRFLWLLAVRPRTFTAPAFVVIPVWAAFEVLGSWLLPSDGTSHLAHVGGFAFGVLAALGLRATGIDRKLDDSVERAATIGDDPRIDEARRMIARGDAPTALAMLEGLALEKPTSAHVQDALAEAARAAGDAPRADKAIARAIALRAAPR